MIKWLLKLGSLLIIVQIFSASALAEEIIGRVVGIADGDTLTILVNEHEQIKVRLTEIDAPENAQLFGQRSKQSLMEIQVEKPATITHRLH